MSEPKELAVKDKGIIALLSSDRVRQEMAMVVPPELNVDTFISKARGLCLGNPDLMKCTEQSILLGIKKAASCGLELDGRNCHLVPFFDKKANCHKATFIVDVKGYMKLALESGMRLCTSALVYDKDNFREWTDDSGPHLLHTIDHRHPRGKVVGAYSLTQNASGAYDHEYMPLEEINAIKARSRASFGPWVTDENEMRRKTVVRRHSKRWPLGSRLAALWEGDDDRLPEIEAKPKLVLPDEVPALPPATANLLPAPVSDNDGGDDEEKEHEWN